MPGIRGWTLGRLGGLFAGRSKKISVKATQAAGLEQAMNGNGAGVGVDSGVGGGVGSGVGVDDDVIAFASIETKPVVHERMMANVPQRVESRSARRFGGSGAGGSGSRAGVDSGDVLGLITRIGDHLDSQSKRTEKLVGLLDRMPAALEAMPEISRQNARLLETLTDHLAQQKQREAAVNEALGCLGAATTRQTDVLGLIQQQLDAGTMHTTRLTETLGEFRSVLEDLSRSNRQSADVLAEISHQAREREQRLLQTMSRSQAWMIAALVGCGIAALTALGIALAVMVGGG